MCVLSVPHLYLSLLITPHLQSLFSLFTVSCFITRQIVFVPFVSSADAHVGLDLCLLMVEGLREL